MRMLHGTLARNLKSINRRGLLASHSQVASRTVWLVSPSMIGPALAHAMKRHGGKPRNIVVFEIEIPRSWLSKGRRKGLHHTGGRDIQPGRIKTVFRIRNFKNW